MQNPGVISRNHPQSVKLSPNTLQFDTIRNHLVMNLTWTQDWYRHHVTGTGEGGNEGRNRISLPDEKGSRRLKLSSMNNCQIFIFFVLSAIFEDPSVKIFSFAKTEKEDDALDL